MHIGLKIWLWMIALGFATFCLDRIWALIEARKLAKQEHRALTS